MPDIVFFNGSYLDRDQVRISPDDRGFLFADGIYEVVRFYGGRPFELQAHLARMVDGLRSLRIEGVEAGTIETVVSELRDRNGLSPGWPRCGKASSGWRPTRVPTRRSV